MMADIKAEYLTCPIRHVLSRFGDKWSMLVLFLLNRSETGVMRFNEIRRFMSDCSQKMLSQTLKNMEQSHLVRREVFPEVPPRVEYSLTETGKSLMPACSPCQAQAPSSSLSPTTGAPNSVCGATTASAVISSHT